MESNVTLTLKNYKGEEIIMDVNSLGQFILLSSFDLSLTQGYCRKALKDPICVFAKDDKELYCIMIGKHPSGFYLLVSIKEGGEKRVEEIKFYPSVRDAQNLAKGWELIHYKE